MRYCANNMLAYPNWQRELAQTQCSLGSNPRASTIMDTWGSGLTQFPAKKPALTKGPAGSNPAVSAIIERLREDKI